MEEKRFRLLQLGNARRPLREPMRQHEQAGANARSRTLINKKTGEMSEPVRVWKALPDDVFGDATLMLMPMLTGQRRQEIGGLGWSELDSVRPYPRAKKSVAVRHSSK
jgi:integrase